MSTLRANTIADAAGTGPAAFTSQAAARMWGNVNGTGTPAIVNSLNLTSLTDNATGDFSLNITNNFADADYAASGGAGTSGGAATNTSVGWVTHSVSVLRIQVSQIGDASASLTDRDNTDASAIGDLA